MGPGGRRPGRWVIGSRGTLAAAAFVLALAAGAGGCATGPGGGGRLPERGAVRRQEVAGPGLTVRVAVPESPEAFTYLVELERDGREQTIDPQRRGNLARVWVADIGDDGTPEALVQTVEPEPNAYGHLDLFYLEGDRYLVRSFPPLAMDQLEGFRGHDLFAVRDGRIYRSYPVYRPDDTDLEPSGGRREFVFDFATESWLPVAPAPAAEEAR